MPLHLVAFAQAILTSGVFQSINPVPDPTVNIQNPNLLVPDKYNKLVVAGALVKANSAGTKAQFQSPSLREVFFPTIDPVVLGTTFDGLTDFWDQRDEPLPLATNEGLNFFSDAGGNGTTAQDVYGVAILADGKVAPAAGVTYSMRATSAAVLVARTFVNAAIVFDQNLPVGNYDIIGMRAQGAGLVAARLVFIGASSITRPGVLAQLGVSSEMVPMFRNGGSGLFGTFYSLTPPSVDCLGDTGTTQQFIFDLVKR